MTDHDVPSNDQADHSADSKGDAIAAVALVLIAVAAALYWVAGQ